MMVDAATSLLVYRCEGVTIALDLTIPSNSQVTVACTNFSRFNCFKRIKRTMG